MFQNLPVGATAEEWCLTSNPNLLTTSRGAADDESDEDEGAIEETTDAIDALEQYWSYTKNFIVSLLHSYNFLSCAELCEKRLQSKSVE